MPYEISVDTGGTFTDAVVSDESGRFWIGKAPSTPERIADGIRDALAAAAAPLGLEVAGLLARTSLLVYGTTAATNAVVTGERARTALLVTEGFEDILVFREGGKHNAHDFATPYPEPYLPRRHTFGVRERLNAEGGVERPLDEAHLREVIAVLQRGRFEAIAVCLLFSVVDPTHERRVGRLLAELLPGVPVTLSHALLPILREFRRASAAAINASLCPRMARHLAGMEHDLRALGYRGAILVSTSGGACMEVPQLVDQPIHLVKSGPAMAPVAAREYGAREGERCNLIVCDAGGTTFDVGLVRDGALVRTRETWLGPRWLGHLVSLSSIDVRSVGAGGGSIAWLDDGGLLRVGPHSAGAEPGPACYARGGTAATVTDAAVVAGYLLPERFLAGRMPLDPERARTAVGVVAAGLRRSAPEAAAAILHVAGETMLAAVLDVTVAEGLDPRECTLVAGGGAAGLTVVDLAREIGCARVLLPRTASALSACGMQFADVAIEHGAGVFTSSGHFARERVEQALASLARDLEAIAVRLETGALRRSIDFVVEARYAGQVWELEVPVPRTTLDPSALAALVEAFHAVHERVFSVRDDASAVEFLAWRARLTVHLEHRRPRPADPAGTAPPRPFVVRPAYFPAVGEVETPFFAGPSLAAGDRVAGPAVVAEPTTTVVLPPGAAATLSAHGCYLIDTGARR